MFDASKIAEGQKELEHALILTSTPSSPEPQTNDIKNIGMKYDIAINEKGASSKKAIYVFFRLKVYHLLIEKCTPKCSTRQF